MIGMQLLYGILFQLILLNAHL